MDREIDALKGSCCDRQGNSGLGLKLRGDPTDYVGISQEELSSVRSRITKPKREHVLKLRQIATMGREPRPSKAGTTRALHAQVMNRLNSTREHTWLLGPDNKDPDSMLRFLEFTRTEKSTKYGPGHPDMVSLNRQIEVLKKEIADRGGPPEDELARHQRRLDNERAAIVKQLEILQNDILKDETNATKMSELQGMIDNRKENKVRDDTLLRDRERERERVTATKSSGGYKVEDVTKPSDGVQIAPVLVQSLLLGAVFGVLLGVGLGLWAELADRSFRSPLDIRRHLGLPVLGHIPPIRSNEPPELKPTAALDPILATHLRPHSAEAEAIRGIRTQLLFNTSGNEHQVLQITSPNPGDGKSTLSATWRSVWRSPTARRARRLRLPQAADHRIAALTNSGTRARVGGRRSGRPRGGHSGCEIENLSLLPCVRDRPIRPARSPRPSFREMLDDCGPITIS